MMTTCKHCGEEISGVGPHMDGTFGWHKHEKNGMTHCTTETDILNTTAEPADGE
jgi:hypothetical protein